MVKYVVKNILYRVSHLHDQKYNPLPITRQITKRWLGTAYNETVHSPQLNKFIHEYPQKMSESALQSRDGRPLACIHVCIMLRGLKTKNNGIKSKILRWEK